ncbi:MAG TPA: SDR family NAD(P)-dependent oxidoreductase, partial [Terracidiphilus sp.]
MNPTGNTILVTGGGSGIGRGLAEELQKQGNHVILAGRRRHVLEETAKANSGMSWMVLDMEHASGITSFVPELLAQYPKLNVVINNAGIMRPEQLAEEPEASIETAEAIVATNLLGPIRMISALIPHFKQQPGSTIVNVSSGL